jgi:threonine dehydratase
MRSSASGFAGRSVPDARDHACRGRGATLFSYLVETHAAVLTLDDVHAARKRIAGRLHRTPMLHSASMSKRVGVPVHFKAELFQRTGSFKPRGVLNKLATLSDKEKQRGVISISAGNHAQALAYASGVEGIDALVVMWQTASPMKIAAARAYGATVDDSPADIPAAFEHLDRLVAETGRTLVHPYDDPRVMAGQGTVGLEIVEDVPDASVILVQVGGGGLVSGIATAVKGLRPDARVIAVEPELSNALQASMAVGEPVTIEPRSLADGLNGPYAGPNCVRVCLDLGVESVLVSEEAIKEAFRWVYGRMKLACEPAGAATAATLLAGKVELEEDDVVAAVVSGGNVAAQTAAAILAEQ